MSPIDPPPGTPHHTLRRVAPAVPAHAARAAHLTYPALRYTLAVGVGEVAEFAVSVAQAEVGAGNLIASADPGGNGVGACVGGNGLLWIAGGVRGLAKAIEYPRLAAWIAGVAHEFESLLEVLGRSLGQTDADVGVAKVIQRAGYSGLAAGLLEQVQGLLVVVYGLLILTQPLLNEAEVVQVKWPDPLGGPHAGIRLVRRPGIVM